MPIHHDQITDFTNQTLSKYERRKWVDITLDLQDYFFHDRLLMGPGSKSGRRTAGGMSGPDLRWVVQVDNDDNFQDSELYGVVETGTTDLTVQAKVEWTKQVTSLTYDIDEPEFQGEMEEIVGILKIKTHAMWNNFYEKMEDRVWIAPTSSTQNPRKPYAIPFWIQKASAAAGSFQGGNPSGFTSGAGNISSSTYPNWDNWAFGYVNVSMTDFVRKTREAIRKTKFKPVHNFASLGTGRHDWELCTTYPVIEEYRDLITGLNDNIGPDPAKYKGDVLQGIPIMDVPALTESSSAAYDSSNPLYGINWRNIEWVCKDKLMLRKHPVITPPKQPTVRKQVYDNWGQIRCWSRREGGFVGHVL
jgi:hypothetical protein